MSEREREREPRVPRAAKISNKRPSSSVLPSYFTTTYQDLPYFGEYMCIFMSIYLFFLLH